MAGASLAALRLGHALRHEMTLQACQIFRDHAAGRPQLAHPPLHARIARARILQMIDLAIDRSDLGSHLVSHVDTSLGCTVFWSLPDPWPRQLCSLSGPTAGLQVKSGGAPLPSSQFDTTAARASQCP